MHIFEFKAGALLGWIPILGNDINAGTAFTVTEAIGWAIANDFAQSLRELEREQARRAEQARLAEKEREAKEQAINNLKNFSLKFLTGAF